MGRMNAIVHFSRGRLKRHIYLPSTTTSIPAETSNAPRLQPRRKREKEVPDKRRCEPSKAYHVFYVTNQLAHPVSHMGAVLSHLFD